MKFCAVVFGFGFVLFYGVHSEIFRRSRFPGINVILNPGALKNIIKISNELILLKTDGHPLQIDDVIGNDYQFTNFQTDITSLPLIDAIAIESGKILVKSDDTGVVKVEADFRAGRKVLFVPLFVYGNVKATAIIDHISIGVEPIVRDGLLKPWISNCDMTLTLKVDRLTSGNLLTSVMSWFEPLIIPIISSVLQSTMCALLPTKLQETVEKITSFTWNNHKEKVVEFDSHVFINYGIHDDKIILYDEYVPRLGSPMRLEPRSEGWVESQTRGIEFDLDGSVYFTDEFTDDIKYLLSQEMFPDSRQISSCQQSLNSDHMLKISIGPSILQALLDYTLDNHRSESNQYLTNITIDQCDENIDVDELCNSTRLHPKNPGSPQGQSSALISVYFHPQICPECPISTQFDLSINITATGIVDFLVKPTSSNPENASTKWALDISNMLNDIHNKYHTLNLPSYITLNNTLAYFDSNSVYHWFGDVLVNTHILYNHIST